MRPLVFWFDLIMWKPTLHPATLMLAYVGLALGIVWFNQNVLWALSGIAGMLMMMTGIKHCWAMLRRARLLFLMMVIVYGYMTPGAALLPAWGNLSPSAPGFELGLMHAWRLSLLLAMLAVLLRVLDRMQLLAGIYQILSPLEGLGLPAQQFAVRLWLTLHYFEERPMSPALGEAWQQAIAVPVSGVDRVEISMPLFSGQDLLFGLLCAALLGWALW